MSSRMATAPLKLKRQFWLDAGSDFPLTLLQLLTWVALVDWLIGRTVSRSAIFMPKPPPVMVVYQALALIGPFSAILTGLLTLGMIGWIAHCEWRSGRIWLPVLLLTQAGLSLVFLFVAPTGWWPVLYHTLSLMAVGLIVGFTIYDLDGGRRRLGIAEYSKEIAAFILPAVALLLGKLYQTLPALYAAAGWPGPPPLTEFFFNLGEFCVTLGAVGLWYAYGRGATWRVWLIAAIPALAFSAAYLANPSMTGILAMWSVGLSLYLPWPVYAISLWLAGVTVIVSLRQKRLTGWAILLLLAAGYAPQLSTHTFLGLIALWLLAQSFKQPTRLV